MVWNYEPEYSYDILLILLNYDLLVHDDRNIYSKLRLHFKDDACTFYINDMFGMSETYCTENDIK